MPAARGAEVRMTRLRWATFCVALWTLGSLVLTSSSARAQVDTEDGLRAIRGAATEPLAVLVLPLDAVQGAKKRQARGVKAWLDDQIDRTDGLKRLKDARRHKKLAKRCGRDPVCLGELADRLGVDLLAAGRIGKNADGIALQLVVVGPGAQDALRTVTELLPNDSVERGALLDRLVREALLPRSLKGALDVDGEHGVLFVDGRRVSALPLEAPVDGLREGHHEIAVHAEGYESYETEVEITHGRITTVTPRLRVADDTPVEPPPPATPGWVKWASTAGTVALAGTAAGLGMVSLDAQTEIDKRAAAEQLSFPRDRALFEQAGTFAIASSTVWVLAAAGAGATAWLFVQDAPEEDESNSTPGYERGGL